MENTISINLKEISVKSLREEVKNEWSDTELYSVKEILEKIFKGKIFTNHANKTTIIENYSDLDNFLGLAYVDTDKLAKLGIANGEKIFINKPFYLDNFMISKNNKLLFVVTNDEEEEKYYETDFTII